MLLSRNVIEAAYAEGAISPGRYYDLMELVIAQEAAEAGAIPHEDLA